MATSCSSLFGGGIVPIPNRGAGLDLCVTNPAFCPYISLVNLGGSDDWWSNFGRAFNTNFSGKGARLPGETWSACVDRTQQALLGNVGTTVLNVLFYGGGAALTRYTTPLPTSIPIWQEAGSPAITVIRSFWEADLAANSRAGTLLANFATRASSPIAKASGLATAIATGIKAGFFVACAH